MNAFALRFQTPENLTATRAESTFYWTSDATGSFVTGRLGPRLGSFGPVRPANADLVRLAALVYASDRSVSRRSGGSNWSRREFRLDVPVSDPAPWDATRERWEGLLGFLSGDAWELTFRRTRLPAETINPYAYPGAERVVLLSGGADSAVGALLSQHELGDRQQVLFSHVGATNIALRQREVAEQIAALTRATSLPHLQARFSRKRRQPNGFKFAQENSTRTRSLLFLALGLAVASVEEIDLHIPENGFASLNVPLGADQRGSVSTRTTHPHFLHELSVVAAASGAHAPVINPLVAMTKGEMFARTGALVGKNAASKFLSLTHSCGHTGHRSFGYPVISHCGVCFGCLLRRASFRASKLRDRTTYLNEATDSRLERYLRENSMETSLRGFLQRPLRPAELLALNLPDTFPLADARSLVERGMHELETLV
jgi:7-cyano-7-deazaguanine synthase in queuosine biosynthesis